MLSFKKLDFDRLRANDNPLRQFLSNYIYNFLFYYSDNTKLIKKKFVRSSEEIKLNEILHFLYMQKNLTLLKLFLPKRYKYLSLENKKIILVQIIINLLFKLKINFNDVYPLKYRRKVMKSVYKLITFALKFNKNSFVLNYEKFLYSFYQGNIKGSPKQIKYFP